MEKNDQIVRIEQLLAELLEQHPAFFAVQVKLKPTNNVKVFVDGDEGITIEDCIKLNRQLYAAIETTGMFPEGEFSLEVSSPGVGEPLLLQRQFAKNVGRLLAVKTVAGAEMTGVLKAADAAGIQLEIAAGKGKKATVALHELSFSEIKQASVQIQF
ncbi:MAG: ribosome maturation factor [Chitinophagaceae bacterium]|nr:ribosome maturation factor [Chitinophagaceae bacterium]